MSKRATLASGAVGLVLILVVLAAATVALGQTNEPTPAGGPARTITVSSGATISTAPDEAVVSFTVRGEDADSVAALDESSRIMNALLAAMKQLGITERDMETTSIKVSQQTLDRGTSFERTVFVSSSTLEVTIGNFERIGPAIRDGVAAGATSVRGVRFQVSDPAEAKRRALDAAVRSARTKADALAQAAGTQVTGVIQISEEGVHEPRPYFAAYDTLSYAGAERDLSVVAPKDIETEVSITSIWAIG